MLRAITSTDGPFRQGFPTWFLCPQCQHKISFFVYAANECVMCDMPFIRINQVIMGVQEDRVAYYETGEI